MAVVKILIGNGAPEHGAEPESLVATRQRIATGVGYALCSAVAHRRDADNGCQAKPVTFVGITPPTRKTATPLSAFGGVIRD